MTTSGRSFGPGRSSAPSRSAPSRGRGFTSERGLANPVSPWVSGTPAGSRTGANDDDLRTDLRKQGRSSPALSAYNGDSKRGRTGTTMPQTSSLPTSLSGSLSRFDSQPRGDLSFIMAPDLLWVRDCSSEPIVYPDSADGPFIVLMESTVLGRNLGRYDPLIIADQINEIIQRERTIHRNGINQIKIVYSGRADANQYISSHDLRIAGYKAFLPISMIRKKATISDIDPRHSPISTLNRLDPRSRDIVTAIRRRTDNDGAPLDTVEFTMETTTIPSTVSLSGSELELFPVIPPPPLPPEEMLYLPAISSYFEPV